MLQGLCASGLRAIRLAGLALVLAATSASAQVSIERDEITAAIKGQDVTIHARVSGDIDEVKLFIRPLLSIDEPYNELEMEKAGDFTYKVTLPLSQQQDVGRLEYYIEAFKAGQSVAKADSLVLSTVDAPFVGAPTFVQTEGLSKEDWKDFIKGRINKPFYKRWWVWAGLAAVAIPVTAVLAGGGEQIPGPPTVALREASESKHDTLFDQICEGQIPMDLSITNGDPPFEVLLTMERLGGKGRANVTGISNPLEKGTTWVAQAASITPNDFSQPGDFKVLFPAIDVTPLGTDLTAIANFQFSAIVRDSRTATTFAGATPGQPLPTSIATALENRSDERLLQEIAFTVVISRCQQ